MTPQNSIQYDSKSQQIICSGVWNLAHLPELQSMLATLSLPHSGEVTLNGASITKMDSAGAWLITQLQAKLERNGVQVRQINFPEETRKLLEIVDKKLTEDVRLPVMAEPNAVAVLGYKATLQMEELQAYLAFIGRLTTEFMRLVTYPSRWRWDALCAVLYRTGYQALPIIALLSFLIGVVLTYQMGLQLRNYGANIYIVDLLGLSVLREFAPLITAIMVAGRTGSAFTASIGMMKLNQEVDALDTLGVTPAELLLIPRIIGLFIALPLLTMWADIFGVLGGMVTSNNMLGITWFDFLNRFPQAIPLRAFIIGIGKAPVFALIIASVGCFQGMQVKNSAESVGQNTTKSVVLAIFFIIVADAIFSIIFSKMKL
jgi:phospholipid/cholesterol/gamma-HCH transport system permease protein